VRVHGLSARRLLTRRPSTEMRHDVTTPRYLMRKAIDNLLGALTAPAPSPAGTLTYTAPSDEEPFKSGGPSGWLSLYTMVTFRPDLGYATARRRAAQQARILQVVEGGLALGVAGALAWTAWVARRRLL
jgi:kynurenine 3-monooxygenase